MNEREMRRLERQHESRRERACEDREVETAEAAAQTGFLVCACCETAGRPGAVEWSDNDGHYLCADADACLWRFRALMQRWHEANSDVLTVYDDTYELPY